MNKVLASLILPLVVAAGASAANKALPLSLNLSEPFGTRSAWQLTASEGPDISDPLSGYEDKAPGKNRYLHQQRQPQNVPTRFEAIAENVR